MVRWEDNEPSTCNRVFRANFLPINVPGTRRDPVLEVFIPSRQGISQTCESLLLVSTSGGYFSRAFELPSGNDFLEFIGLCGHLWLQRIPNSLSRVSRY